MISTAPSITFKVKDVDINTVSHLNDFDYIQLLKSNTSTRLFNNKQGQKKLSSDRYIKRTSIKDGSKSINGSYLYSSFIGSAVKAFSNHHKLIIRPDDIWMAILNVFSIYINNNSEKLRDQFVSFNGKEELKVNSKEDLFKVPIDQLIDEMTNVIKSNIKDPSVRDWLIPSFTTTTYIDKIVYSAALMSSLKSYFDYTFLFECGLPEVTLFGSVDDWMDIKDRFNKVSNYDCGTGEMIKWVQLLNPVLDKFIETSLGNIDKDWWNSIATVYGLSGTVYTSGWITCFCIYNSDGKCLLDNKYNGAYNHDNGDNGQLRNWLEIENKDLVQGYLTVPIKLKNLGRTYQSELYCGHLTVEVLNNDTLKPKLDWCLIIDSKEQNESNKEEEEEEEKPNASSNHEPINNQNHNNNNLNNNNNNNNNNKITHRINNINNINKTSNTTNTNTNSRINNNNRTNANNKTILIILITTYILIISSTAYYKYNYS